VTQATDSATPASAPPSKVLVVGLDMADGGLLRAWSEAGHMPHLAALLGAGSWLELDSPAAVLHTSAWPTFATGALPGRHGVYYPYQPKPGHQQAQLLEPDQYGMPTFWEIAGRARDTLVYDIPETFPSTGFAGRGIFDWGTWAWYGTPASQPDGLLGELKAKFGSYPLGMEAKRLGLGKPDPAKLAERLLASVDYKRQTAAWLLESAPWDLAVIGFCELHPGGHYLWPSDAAQNGLDAPAFAPLRSLYQAIDRALGALHAALPDGATLLVVSGDGVRPNHCGWHLLPQVMERLGYAPASGSGEGGGGKAGGGSLLGRIKQAVPPDLRRKIADNLPWWLRDRIGAQIQAAQIDWPRTRAFTLPTDLEGCIRINLKGREPEGIVERGAEYDALCAEIADRLGELTNPATGAPAVERVWRTDEVFPGDHRDHLPDLVVTWRDEAPIAALESPRFGRIEEQSPDPRTGTHSTTGFLLAVGPGIEAPGNLGARLVDVAPTVLARLGLADEARAMDGQALAAGGAQV
jgi:predicted AlkP superfamily phosphohydrolase/phosphomutase